MAEGSKIGERLRETRKGTVRDKDLGDLWRLMAVADPEGTVRVIGEFVDHPEVGADVRQSVQWTVEVLTDPLSPERTKSAFDTFVNPVAIDRLFGLWRDALVGRGARKAPRDVGRVWQDVGVASRGGSEVKRE